MGNRARGFAIKGDSAKSVRITLLLRTPVAKARIDRSGECSGRAWRRGSASCALPEGGRGRRRLRPLGTYCTVGKFCEIVVAAVLQTG
jgi:hypothetical protein